jgi:hypothetical protein
MARDRQVTQGICSRLLVPLEPLFPAAFSMELAGLEPATSWVRFTREASPPIANVRRLCQPPESAARPIATLRDASSSLLDQNLTIEPIQSPLAPCISIRRGKRRATVLDRRASFVGSTDISF